MNHTEIVSRRFLGNITDFSDKRERNAEGKHLKAYLKGYQLFQNGVDELKFLKFCKVQQHYIRAKKITS